MTWLTEWRALAARIEGLATAGVDLAASLHDGIDGARVVQDFIRPSGHRLLLGLKSFSEKNGAQLPLAATEVLTQFLDGFKGNFLAGGYESRSVDRKVLQVIASMRALRAELDYYFADTEGAARRVVERAFMHLQRSLAADDEIRGRWDAAGGEVGCEKLGALHLLAHGVWAFKADAVGARTDLILGHRIGEEEPRASDVEAFVLTEWKVAKKESDVRGKVDEAHTQLRLYRGGALGGFELSTRRYVVVVADQELELPLDHDEGGARCRHLLLNRGGETPSASARR